MFASATVRLLARALLAGLAVFAAKMAENPAAGSAAVWAAATAGLWAATEYLSPLNKLVGPGKGEKPAPVRHKDKVKAGTGGRA